MSEAGSDIDFLSFCPSLVDIFLFLDFKDIQKCELSNRRICHVIHRNSLSLPRREIRFFINILNNEQRECVRIEIDRKIAIYVMEKETIALKCPNSPAWNRLISVVPTSDDNSDKEIAQGFLELFASKSTERSVKSFRNNGIEDELHKLCSFLFRQFYIYYMRLGPIFYSIPEKVIPEKWLNIVADEFSKTICRCNYFKADKIMPGVQRLVTSLDSPSIRIDSVFNYNGDLFEVRTILNWNIRTVLMLDVCQLGFFEAVKTLIKDWEKGDVTLKKLKLETACNFADDVAPHSAFFYNCSVETIFDELKHVNAIRREIFEKDTTITREILVTRPLDNKFLSIKLLPHHRKKGNHWTIEEYSESTMDPEGFRCFRFAENHFFCSYDI